MVSPWLKLFSFSLFVGTEKVCRNLILGWDDRSGMARRNAGMGEASAGCGHPLVIMRAQMNNRHVKITRQTSRCPLCFTDCWANRRWKCRRLYWHSVCDNQDGRFTLYRNPGRTAGEKGLLTEGEFELDRGHAGEEPPADGWVGTSWKEGNTGEEEGQIDKKNKGEEERGGDPSVDHVPGGQQRRPAAA